MYLPIIIIDFFNSLNDEEMASLKKIFEGDFSDAGGFTILTQKFVENDETLIECILPCFIEYLETYENQNKLLIIKKEEINKEVSFLYQKLEKNPCLSYELQIEHKEKELMKLSMSSLKEASICIFDEIVSKMEIIKNNPKTLTADNYYYITVLDILYKDFNASVALDKKYKKPLKKENKLYKYFKSLDIDIKDADGQFNKYDLLSVSSSDDIVIGLPSRIFDPTNNAQFMVDLPEQLLEVFKSLLNSSEIKKISFLVESEVVFETNEQYFILFGNHQPESPITLSAFVNDNRDKDATREIIKKPESINIFPAYISAGRFVENNDSAWYFIDNSNIYLEEILDDTEVLDDCVVTQLIHIEYYTESDKIYISHIDHEYIFYSYDEFDQRLKDFSQKGSARKRIKTFKVDESKVPLIPENKVLLLNTILECLFTKPYLFNGFIRELINKNG